MGNGWFQERLPTRRLSMKHLTVALALTGAILLFAACGAESAPPEPTMTPTPTQALTKKPTSNDATAELQSATICAEGKAPGYLKQVVLARNTEGTNFTPVEITEEYSPSDTTFHAVATLEGAPANTKLRAVWYLLKASGYTPETKIDENELSVGEGGSRNVDFTLKNTQDKWPSGAYCVEVYADGTLALSKKFTVTGETTPSTAGVDVLTQVVLAEDTDPGSFKPINPTTTFKKDAAFIHAAIQIQDAPLNTIFRARWNPPNQEPLDFDLTTNGTRWLDFRLTPAPDGFPAGEYKVEIYVNDQLADTKTFTVE